MHELKRIIDRFNKIYIQPHNYPDADAIASAWAMKKIVESFGKEAEIIYYGSNIFKSNISKVINEFKIKMTQIYHEFEINDGEALITVDCQYSAGNVLFIDAKSVIVIDHHIKEILKNFLYEDIQPRIGSCSTIIFNYLKYYGIDIDKSLATVLYYGIFMDTDMFNGKMTIIDEDAKKELSLLYDKNIIEYLRLSSLSFEDLKVFASSILKTERYNDILFSGVDECDDNLLGHISDLLLQIEGINIVIIYSSRNNAYKLSIRSYHNYLTAEEIARELTEGVGSGGGHENKAGGHIMKESFERLFPHISIGIFIRTKVIDYSRGIRLLQTAQDNPFDIYGKQKFFLAKKKAYCLRYLDINEYFKEQVAVKTIEGITTASETDKVIIGVKSEILTISNDQFHKNYKSIVNKLTKCLSEVYIDQYGITIQSSSKSFKITKDNITDFKVCMTIDNSVTKVIKLDEKIKVRTSKGDFFGKIGDYLLVNSIEDYSICDGDVFDCIYEIL